MKNENEEKDLLRLSSEDLAALIIDALYMGGVLSEDVYEKAVTIATEEIDARKAGGDY